MLFRSKDFATISLVGQMPNVMIVRPSLPVKSLKELVEYAKANPGKLNYGSGGIGSTNQLASELFKSFTKINMVHVPYKGSIQAMTALLGGEVDMVMIGVPPSLPHIKSGKVRPLAVLSPERLPALPDVPTSREAGVDNFEVSQWYGVLAPAGTPRDIITHLNAEWVKIASMPDTMEKMRKVEFEPMSMTPIGLPLPDRRAVPRAGIPYSGVAARSTMVRGRGRRSARPRPDRLGLVMK